jgi:transcriptional regulator with XRE-family HTH domain
LARRRRSDYAIILVFLREGLGWSQPQLERAAGLAANMVGDYENGHKQLTRERLEYVVSFLGAGPERIDALLAELETARLAARSGPLDLLSSRRRKIEAIAAQFGRMAASFARAALHLLTLGSERAHAHDQADYLWRRLKRNPPEDRLLLVEEDRRYRKWGLVVLVVQESLDAAANRPKEALELAQLAMRTAELVTGAREWRWRLQGYAGAALINGYRVCSDLPAARKARARARQLWEDGEPGDPGLLDEALLPWVEAALHRAERDFSLALKRIDEALELDKGELKGKILLTKANIHDALDEPEASTAAILEAIPLIDTDREPRLAWGVLYNLGSDLVHLGRADEARQRLPELRRLAERLGGELDLVRLVWHEAKVAAALGDLKGARQRLEQVRNAFDKPELRYDHAFVNMDLSVVLLEQGETARVRTLSEEMLRIYRSQEVLPEALAAIRVFCEAVKQETATVELARRVVRFLYRAKANPDLKFEAEAG